MNDLRLAGSGRNRLGTWPISAHQAQVPTLLPLCPHLPTPRDSMDWRSLSAHRAERGSNLYLAALEYGNFLWQRGFAARSILCLDRAFGAELLGDERFLKEWPLPYNAMAWVLASTPAGVFIGNPRVHFQHYADRMNEPRREQRRWRAWACWEISRVVLPQLRADPKHKVIEPSREEISAKLTEHGLRRETDLWCNSLQYAGRLVRERRAAS